MRPHDATLDPKKTLVENGADAEVSSDDPAEPFLTIPEAAKRLGIPDWTLRRAIKRGDIPAFSFATNRRRVRMSEIEKAVRAARQGVNASLLGVVDQ